MNNAVLADRKLPVWILLVAVLGAAWNAFGLYQLNASLSQSEAGLMMQGMSAEAARVYHNLPLWMNLAFAVGAGGGLLGCLALIARRGFALPVLVASLAGYVVLFAGDLAYGLFDLIPGQMAILLTVLAIAIILMAVAIHAQRKGLLR